MIKSAFTWDYERNQPIAKPAPYTPNFKDACKVGDTLAKAIAPMPVQTFRSTKAVAVVEVENHVI